MTSLKGILVVRRGRFWRGRLSEERGDVLMEYVLITMLIILPLVGVSVGLVNPGGQMFSPGNPVTEDDFGLLGNAFKQRYRMVMSGLSLPLP